MPTSLAASTTSVPAGTASLWPSIVMLTSGMRGHSSDVACVPKGVVLVLLAEMAHRRVDDPPTGVAESAEAAAGPEAFPLAAFGRPAGELHDHVAEGLAELDLVNARLAHVSAHGQQTRARRLVGAELCVFGAAHVHDHRHGGERFDVVEQSRPAPRAFDRGKRRTRAWLGAPAFERF